MVVCVCVCVWRRAAAYHPDDRMNCCTDASMPLVSDTAITRADLTLCVLNYDGPRGGQGVCGLPRATENSNSW